jgi:hypothetical protein
MREPADKSPASPSSRSASRPRPAAKNAPAALIDRRPAADKIAQLAGLANPPAPAANRTGLPDALKSGVEQLSGVSLDSVRVHRNSSKPAQLGAHAYAQGNQIHLAPGQERHLPHEAWHVVQQAQGRVQPTRQMTGSTPINDDHELEDEADVMGAKAMQMKARLSPAARKPASWGSSINESIVQRAITVGFVAESIEYWVRELNPDGDRAATLTAVLRSFDGKSFSIENDFVRAVAAATVEFEKVAGSGMNGSSVPAVSSSPKSPPAPSSSSSNSSDTKTSKKKGLTYTKLSLAPSGPTLGGYIGTRPYKNGGDYVIYTLFGYPGYAQIHAHTDGNGNLGWIRVKTSGGGLDGDKVSGEPWQTMAAKMLKDHPTK